MLSKNDIKFISESEITDAVKSLCLKACCELSVDVVSALESAYNRQTGEVAKNILGQLIKNAEMARQSKRPCCQDTGMTVVFVDIGNRVVIDGDIYSAINAGVRAAYCEGYLRKSVLSAITRENTGDNTPAIVHVDFHPGNDLHITVAPKGFGSENMSRIAMFKPSEGLPAACDFIVDTMRIAGANPCPPCVLGVGIGGNFETSALLAKKQLLRPIGSINPDKMLADIEKELIERINKLNIGPMGLGGETTVLAVHVAQLPTHLAGFPVAVNVQCHACRHAEIVI